MFALFIMEWFCHKIVNLFIGLTCWRFHQRQLAALKKTDWN
ncbi:hypothetical protein BN130_3837 [Cronobacter malonaticus 507]|nr:hypothetical protein BN130_3837 [Cronobacter malonaticus 507]